MLDWIRNALGLLDAVPAPVWAVLAAWLVSWGMTQRIKFLIPARWPSEARQWTVRTVAFVIAVMVALAVYPGRPGLILAIVAGLWSPAAYAVAQWGIRRKWPSLADALSQDVRGGERLPREKA